MAKIRTKVTEVGMYLMEIEKGYPYEYLVTERNGKWVVIHEGKVYEGSDTKEKTKTIAKKMIMEQYN